MQNAQHAQLEVLLQVQAFLDRHAHELSEINSSAVREEFDAAVAGIRDAGENQVRSERDRRELTRSRQELRDRLRKELRRLVTITRANPATFPAFERDKVPRRTERDDKLQGHAIMLADSAARHRAELARHGLGDDFPERLSALAAELGEAAMQRDFAELHRKHSTSTIGDGLRRAWILVEAMRALLDDENPAHRALRDSWRVTTIHARRLPKPAEVPRIRAPARQLALPPGPAHASGVPVDAETGEVTSPAHPRALRRSPLRALAARFFTPDRTE